MSIIKHRSDSSSVSGFDSELDEQFSVVLATLQRGEAAIFPTDTVYGIGVAVTESASPEAIYQLKGRDRDKPIPWLVADKTALDVYAENAPIYAYKLAKDYWPGALTLIVAASDKIPLAFRAKDNTIALRMPDDEIALALIKKLGVPLATTSANLQGQVPATSKETLNDELLRSGIPVIDAGSTAGPLPSTIVSCLGEKPVIVRKGVLYDSILARVISLLEKKD